MTNYQLANFLGALESWGLTDVLLPFLLIFTLVFAVLQKTEILGDDKKNFNVIIALVLGLLFVVPHIAGAYPIGYDPVQFIIKDKASYIVVFILILVISFSKHFSF